LAGRFFTTVMEIPRTSSVVVSKKPPSPVRKALASGTDIVG
jgi:hypothetical protein